ncbi:MAG: MAPEG family protein [Cyanobacteria bacterium]|nr:MAPEG family protein [Cyanobacteria bacterium CG_2015-16_32_12]NCO78340.1 MAPEG family protein [Cyanobacteria bacterium CG_2015-22_32_23]NCQ03230.1 MAPEG family protein [Cyanobacteria bacterium CG_2015-09_32_10]NCQ42362.1 MAPEG family protein [Cyanobacteria bacterium CG_2015-04_32_10]NCS83773.1 MAPEG family protein [Cyanobacteria bacterium CG_2015-02_32_10]
MLLGASIITVSALLVYFVTIINVGRARVKYNVMPPAMSGDPNFERALRVQENMLEQLIFFLPLLWIFSYYVSELWGAILGGIWILGRVLYAWGYYQEAKKRTLGFGISSLSGMSLLLGCLISLVMLGIKTINF